MKNFSHLVYVIFLVTLFSLIWSSAFIAGKIGLNETPPFTILAVRFLLAGVIILIPYYVFTRKPITKPEITLSVVLGLLNNVIYLGCTFKALQYISASSVILIVSTGPPLIAIGSVTLKSEERYSGRSSPQIL
jgi:drug/metabolite transporter (DMT)-like permease